MKSRTSLTFWVIGMTGGLLLFASSAFAQAPAGPMTSAPQPAPGTEAKLPPPPPPPAPRQSILGAWKLNRDESDDMRNRTQDSDNGSNSGRRGGTGWPGGGGGGGYGGRRAGMGGESDEQRQQMHELLSPPATMKLSMTGAELDLMDDHDRKRAFMTDGRKLQKSKDSAYEEIAAKWDGSRLVSDEKSPRGGKMSRSFELSPDGRQLYENLHIEGSGKHGYTMEVHYVYDILVEQPAK